MKDTETAESIVMSHLWGDPEEASTFREFIFWAKEFSERLHAGNRANGFWDKELNVGEKIALCHSELSEALEGHRKGLHDDHISGEAMFDVELADAVIRIFDLAQGMNIDLPTIIAAKVLYNRTRGKLHGKNKF